MNSNWIKRINLPVLILPLLPVLPVLPVLIYQCTIGIYSRSFLFVSTFLDSNHIMEWIADEKQTNKIRNKQTNKQTRGHTDRMTNR